MWYLFRHFQLPFKMSEIDHFYYKSFAEKACCSHPLRVKAQSRSFDRFSVSGWETLWSELLNWSEVGIYTNVRYHTVNVRLFCFCSEMLQPHTICVKRQDWLFFSCFVYCMFVLGVGMQVCVRALHALLRWCTFNGEVAVSSVLVVLFIHLQPPSWLECLYIPTVRWRKLKMQSQTA